MIVIEEGISDRSFAISMVATLLGFAFMIACMYAFTPNTPNWIQLPAAGLTAVLFGIGIAAWMGKFDKKLKPIEQVVNEVLAGAWGDGNERIEALTKAGYNYGIVQGMVNQRLIETPVVSLEEKVKPVPKEDWATKWMKENT